MKASSLPVPALVVISLAWAIHAQPTPAPFTGDLACLGKNEVVDFSDTVASLPDHLGYRSLFDGTFKGWYHNCETGHSRDASGAIFRIGQSEGRPAIYTNQGINPSTGGILMTKRKFTNYELAFQFWTGYGNEAGIFNRATRNGRSFRTSLTTASGGTMGGSWGEGGFTHRDFRPFAFWGDMQTIGIPGNNAGEMSNWTTITRKLKAGSEPDLPCTETGCTQEDWRALWNFDGWTDIKIRFYGGLMTQDGKPQRIGMKIWFKKPAATVWVPLIQDTTLQQLMAPGHIGIMVYGAGRFTGPLGTWYRDIRWRELDADGEPTWFIPIRTVNRPGEAAGFNLSAGAGLLTGTMPEDYAMDVLDLGGRILERFSGRAGQVRHTFASPGRGVQLLRVRTAGASETLRIVR